MTGPGRPTLADVAAEAGVSTALVSIVVRGAPGASAETRRHVAEVVTRLGYRPDSRARLLRSGRSRLLGVVFDVGRHFHGELVTGLYVAAGRIGYELTLSAVTPRRGEAAAIDSLLQDRCEAVVAMSLTSTTAQLVAVADRLPVVVVARPVRHRSLDVVRNDDAQGLSQAVDHLVELGHRRITHIDGGRGAVPAERRRGYLDAMRRHGLERFAHVIPGGTHEEDGVRAVQAVLGAAAMVPTAIATYNDECAIGALQALRREGLSVPGDVSVIGYDDERLSGLGHVDLTTVGQDAATMTTLAVGRARDRIEGNPVSLRELVIPPRLVIRGTAAPPGHQAGLEPA